MESWRPAQAYNLLGITGELPSRRISAKDCYCRHRLLPCWSSRRRGPWLLPLHLTENMERPRGIDAFGPTESTVFQRTTSTQPSHPDTKTIRGNRRPSMIDKSSHDKSSRGTLLRHGQALTVEPFDLHHCKARWRLTLRSDSRSILFPIRTNGKRSGSGGAAWGIWWQIVNRVKNELIYGRSENIRSS